MEGFRLPIRGSHCYVPGAQRRECQYKKWISNLHQYFSPSLSTLTSSFQENCVSQALSVLSRGLSFSVCVLLFTTATFCVSLVCICIRMSQFWILLELRMMEVVVTTGARRRCKAPVKSSPATNQHPTFYRLDALPVAKPTVSEH